MPTVDFSTLTRDPLLPVVDVGTGAQADLLIAIAQRGGLGCVEVVMRSPFALDAIERVASAGLVVAAGTVRTEGQVDAAVERGARVIVSAGLSARLAAHCAARDLLYVPGVVTSTEILAAAELGLRDLKFFPAEASGGARTLASLAGPFPEVRFIATGGVTPANLVTYLRLPNVAAVGGGWMMPGGSPGTSDPAAEARFRADLEAARRTVGARESR